MQGSSKETQERARKERRDKGRVMITQRDLLLLTWMGQQYAVRLDQVQTLLGRYAQRETLEPGQVSQATAQRVVERWSKLGFVESDKYFHKQPAWMWLTSLGLRQLGLDYRSWKPTVSSLEHIYWLNQVRLYMEGRDEPMVWKSERELRREYQKKPTHYADAEITLSRGVIGVEVELTRKRPRLVVATLEHLAQTYKTIWYFTNEQTRELITNSLTELPEDWQRRFRVLTLSQVA